MSSPDIAAIEKRLAMHYPEAQLRMLQDEVIDTGFVVALGDAIRDLRALLDRVKELEANRGQWIALARRAATDSCITTDDGPGCFFCDYEEHTKDCPYDALLTGVVNEEASDE